MRGTSLRRLIVNADDLGLTPGVNRGILEAHRAGVVTSASVMVNAPGFEDALRVAREAPTLGLGLHLNLVQGRPLASVPTLTDSATGKLYSLGALAWRALLGRVDPADVRAETSAQIGKLRVAGIAITHLDSHRHSHLLPRVSGAVIAAALEAGIDVVRQPREPALLHLHVLSASAKKLALSLAMGMARRQPVRSADHFVGISLQGSTHFLPRLLRVLDRLRPGTTELMVHVGYADPPLAELDTYVQPRRLELEALTSPEVTGRLQRGDIQLISFSQL